MPANNIYAQLTEPSHRLPHPTTNNNKKTTTRYKDGGKSPGVKAQNGDSRTES